VPEDDEQSEGDVGLGRTLALSDGVFAISMTLLAFQIQPPPPPAKGDVHRFLVHDLAKMSDLYWVYVLSFTVIGLLWLVHHRLFRHVVRADEVLMGVNLFFLMVVAALPFPSAVLGRYGNERVSVVLYAATMSLAAWLLTALTIVVKHRNLMGPSGSEEGLRQGKWRAATTATVFALSIPIAFVATSIAPLTWIATLLVRFIPLPGLRRKAMRPPRP
jgi:uncharacterized membrane protein